ncbi:MAG: DUF4091 domain-containing protein, partial [Clostridia bacterium]|nr:DUF4091 domain-containing protein [Clostridia bacterium]
RFDEVASEERAPGLFPDMLVPRPSEPEIVSNPQGAIVYSEKDVDEQLAAVGDSTSSVWFTVNQAGEILEAGKYELEVTLTSLSDGEAIVREHVTLDIVDAVLPENDLIYTNWLYTDSIAKFYDVELYSDRFFGIFFDTVKNAALHMMNTLLLPAFTPPLDTPEGEERMNVQLVGVEKQGDTYKFDFTLFEKYIMTALDAGIVYLEHNHMYSQWGAKHAPNIYAYVDGCKKRIFGWETDADGEEYKSFLSQYIPALQTELDALGLSDRIVYHISDEPGRDAIESFKSAADTFLPLIGNSRCIDALSDVRYYKEGLVRTPVVSLDHAEDFLEAGADMMLYYTCGYYEGGYLNKCTNRLVTSKPYRTRIIGTQLYRYGAKGFLHWGYNYYFDRMSRGMFDPKTNACGYKQMPGCSYLAYPANDGSTYPSLREKYMCEAICDYRALKLLESLKGREYVTELIDRYFGERVSVTTIPENEEQILSLKNMLYDEISKA